MIEQRFLESENGNTTALRSIYGFALLCFVAIHVAIVTVYNSPESAARNSLAPAIALYSNSPFNQGWSLFAPNPPITTYHLFARRLSGSRAIRDWRDISEIYRQKWNRNSLSPDHTISAALGHAVSTLMGRHHFAAPAALSLATRISGYSVAHCVGTERAVTIRLEVREFDVHNANGAIQEEPLRIYSLGTAQVSCS